MAEERLTRARFIRLGAALGVGAAGASVIAACGGSSGGSGEGGGGDGGGGDAADLEATDRGATGGVEGATQAPGEAAGGEGGGEQQEAAGEGAIASESDVPVGEAVEFTDESGQPAVLVHLENGDFAAYSAVCTHQQCTVAYQGGSGQLACPCHGSVFDPADGAAVVNGPAQTPLPEVPVEVRDGQVYRA